MTVVAEDSARARLALSRVDELQDIARGIEDGEARDRLLRVADEVIADVGPVRISVAAALLGLDEKTVRAWAVEGVLAVATDTPTVRLDPVRLHQVLELVKDLRAAGATRGLLDEVYARLSDHALLFNPDLHESLAQMRRGEGIVVRALPATR